MARRGRLCHASLARCSQNLRRRIPCRQGADRSSTKASAGAGCPAGHRPCVDRICRPNIGCCSSHDRQRSISPGCQAGNCQSIVFAAEPLRMIPRATTMRKLSIPWGKERLRATASWVGTVDRLAAMLAECGNAMPRPPPSAATQVLHLPAHDTGQSSKGTLVESALDDNCADDAAYGQPIARSADASAPPTSRSNIRGTTRPIANRDGRKQNGFSL
jgi:hypothetical protein